jgi:hypothetical protein
MHRNTAVHSSQSSATAAVTAADGSSSSNATSALILRERAGTTDDFDFFDASSASGGAATSGFLVGASGGGGGLDDSISGSIMDAGMFDGGMSPSGVPSAIGNGGGGQSILQEMGASIAASQATASTGITTVKNVGPADGNVANLPFLLQRAAASAVKSISKDVVIDIILKDLRKAMEAEKVRNDEIEKFGISLDEDILGGDDDEDEEDQQQFSGSSERKSASSKAKKSGQLSPSIEYAAKREELRMRPFDDICRLLSVKSTSTSAAATLDEGGASSSGEDSSSSGNSDLLNAAFAVCSACLHVMHQHYLILQWHRAPFDARNNHPEQEFLHRCGLDEIDPARGESDLDAAAVVAVDVAHRPAAAPFTGVIGDRDEQLTGGGPVQAIKRTIGETSGDVGQKTPDRIAGAQALCSEKVEPAIGAVVERARTVRSDIGVAEIGLISEDEMIVDLPRVTALVTDGEAAGAE